jgi:hypothetical protein
VGAGVTEGGGPQRITVQGGVEAARYVHRVKSSTTFFLQFILFRSRDFEKAKGLKVVLSSFEKLSGLKINFDKSELFCFGETRDRLGDYVQLFGVRRASFPSDTWEFL